MPRARHPIHTRFDTERKRDLRAARRAALVVDPDTGEQWSSDPGCRHGTASGYEDFTCRCLGRGPVGPDPRDPHGPWAATSCRVAGIHAAATRRSTKRNAEAETVPIPALAAFRDSALAMLDTHRLMPRPA